MVNVRNGLSLLKLKVFIIFICGLAEILETVPILAPPGHKNDLVVKLSAK